MKKLNILGKIDTMVKVIRLFENWPVVILSYLGLYGDTKLLYALRTGIRYRVASPKNGRTITEIWSNRRYALSNDEMQSGCIVVDVGAHVGMFSIFAASRSDGVRVLSYEPHPDNFRLLTENIRLNGLKNVQPFSWAVSGASGKRKLFVSPEDMGHSLIRLHENYVEVDCVTLKQVLSQIAKCDFLKIDCEGAEYEILFNTPVGYLRKVNRILVECHNPAGFASEHKNWSPHDLKIYLEQTGFKVTLDELGDRPYTYLYGKR